MQNPTLLEQLNELNGLLDTVPTDINVQVHWGRYMCIMAAGFVENALQIIYKEYVSSAGNTNVVRYASKQIDLITNPNAGRFTGTARMFNETWRKDLRAFIAHNGRREAINTLMKNRHSIAHGGQSVISVTDVKGYLKKCVEVVDFIENQCLGQPQSNP